MNISFHYFAVKTLALEAGFSEPFAQQIANFSQYIDDYDAYHLRQYDNIPDWVKNPPYDLYINSPHHPYNFNPVTTGFWDIGDLISLMTSRSQKYTVAPFHFIPSALPHTKDWDRRTSPASLDDASIISKQLRDARLTFTHATDVSNQMHALMLIGSRLHTFADTYAHQLFSGYNESCNNVTLLSVTNNITGKDETVHYQSVIHNFLEGLSRFLHGHQPTVGHMMLEHIPDYPWLSFSMRYPKFKGVWATYSRSNTEEFLTVSREILNYLRDCLDKPAISPPEWKNLASRLTQCFLFDETRCPNETALNKSLTAHWSTLWEDKGYNYSYNRHDLFADVIGMQAPHPIKKSDANLEKPSSSFAMSDAFYLFNSDNDELLIALYGSQPRRTWFDNPYKSSADFMTKNDDASLELLAGRYHLFSDGKPLM